MPVLVWGNCKRMITLLDNTRPKRVRTVVGEIRLYKYNTNKPKDIRIPQEKVVEYILLYPKYFLFGI